VGSCLLVLIAAAPFARAAGDCAKQVKDARKAANASMKKKGFADARKTLEAAWAACGAQAKGADKLWLLSDLAFAQLKAGDKAACLATIELADDETVTANPKPGGALQHNAKLCSDWGAEDSCDYKLDDDKPVCRLALALEYAARNPFKPAFPACDLDKKKDGVKLREGVCLRASEAVRKGDEEDLDMECPVFSLVEKKDEKLVTTKLAIDGESWATDPSNCCCVGKLGVNPDGTIVVTNDTPCRDCFGGTATIDLFEVYKLQGATLQRINDATVVLH
jgi:hypothetical protein